MHRLLSALLALLLVSAPAAGQFVAGKDYEQLPSPQPTEAGDAVELREFFSYGCPHCFTFRPKMHDWLAKQPEGRVKFVRTPVVFNESWRILAKAYYVAEAMNAVDKIHVPLFEAIHVKHQDFRREADLIDFFAAQGLERDKVKAMFGSFTVDAKVRQADQIARNYRIMSTPSVAVAGRYVVSPGKAGGHERMLQVIDALVGRAAK